MHRACRVSPILLVATGVVRVFLGMSVFGLDPLGPRPPNQCPFLDKKGTSLLLSEFCILLHTHQDTKLVLQSHGTKTETQMPMHSPTLLTLNSNHPDPPPSVTPSDSTYVYQ